MTFSVEDDTDSSAGSSASNVASEMSINETVMRQYNVLETEVKGRANFRTCMTEREFHIKIAKQKKKVGLMMHVLL